MRPSRLLSPLLALALFAVACGSATDVAGDVADAVDDAVDDVAEVVEDDEPEEAETTTTEAPVEETTTTEAPETTTTEAAAEEEPAEEVVDGAVAIDGGEIYQSSCSRCHGNEGQGGRGPNIQGIGDRNPIEDGITVVTNGLGSMPSFGNSLSTDEIQAVVDFVWETL